MKTKELRQAYYTATVSEFQKDVERGQYIEKNAIGWKVPIGYVQQRDKIVGRERQSHL